MKPLSAEQENLLLELLHHETVFANTPRPIRTYGRHESNHLEVWAWDDTRAGGILYRPSQWFGDISDKVRQRYIRAIAALERDGLVTVTREGLSNRVNRLKLTKTGRAMVAELLGAKAATADVRAHDARATQELADAPGSALSG